MCQCLNSTYFHIIGDGHQPNSRGLYTHYKDSLLKVGWPSPIQGVDRPWLIYIYIPGLPSDPFGSSVSFGGPLPELGYYDSLKIACQVLPSDLFGGFKWPFQGLSDLYLGDQKVTWKKLVVACQYVNHFDFIWRTCPDSWLLFGLGRTNIII